MKRRIISILSLLILVLIIFNIGTVFAQTEHKPITKELIELIEENPEVGELLEKSIALAKEANPNPETNPVQSLDDYYAFIDRTSTAPPWELLEYPFPTLFDQIDQSLNYFYFLIDQPLPELEDEDLYMNSIQYYEPFDSWQQEYLDTWKTFLDSEESWNDNYYQMFYDDPKFNLQGDLYESPSNWKTWNEFFARKLSSPDMRPISSPDDPAVVVSPADSLPQGEWEINDESEILVEGEEGLKVKSETFYSIEDLLGTDSPYKDVFAGGMLTHTYLAENDYHRYHFPVGGTVEELKEIPDDVAVGGTVVWGPEENEYLWIPSTGWQFSETRGYVVMDTGEYGTVAVIPVGMSQIASINFEDDVKVGTTHEKGDPLGYFLFGGSDIIMLFEEDVQFEMTAPMENKTDYEHILMGEEYGIMKAQPESDEESDKGYWWIGLMALLFLIIVIGMVFLMAREHKKPA